MKVDNNITPCCYSYIRFSTPEQKKGDSLRRQQEASKEYAESRGLILNDSLNLQDEGVSAFSGDNKTKGSLGRFLELVLKGKISKGSILIVESLDRLSREAVLDALQTFLSILKEGITVVTLMDNKEYTEKKMADGIHDLLISITIMARAHEESLTKSKRLGETWRQKRAKLKDVKMTKTCPAWLTLSEDRKAFHPIAGRLEIIERIFNLSVSGYGVNLIAKKFNEEGIPVWGTGKGWHASYIQKVLYNRAVIGEFQPHTRKDRVRVPTGEPITDYFPRMIDDELFYQVHTRLSNNPSTGGRSAKIGNLFRHLAICGYCGSPMNYVHKGNQQRIAKYFVCDSGRRGRGCDYVSIRYNEVENAILTFCKEIDFDAIFSDEDDQNDNQEKTLKRTIESREAMLAQAENRQNNLLDSLSDENNKELRNAIKNKIKEPLNDIEIYKKEISESRKDLYGLEYERKQLRSNINNISDFYNNKSLENIDNRIKLRAHLQSILKKVVIYPAGERVDEDIYQTLLNAQLEIAKKNGNSSQADVEKITNHVRETLFHGVNDRSRRCIRLELKNGKIMVLRPSLEKTKEYMSHVEIDGDSFSVTFPGEDTPREFVYNAELID